MSLKRTSNLKLLLECHKTTLLLKMCSYTGCAKENQRIDVREWSCLVAVPRRLVCAQGMKPPLLPQPRKRAPPRPPQPAPLRQVQPAPQPLKQALPHQHKQRKLAHWQHVDALKLGKAGATIATRGLQRIGAMSLNQTVKLVLEFGAKVLRPKLPTFNVHEHFNVLTLPPQGLGLFV